MAKPLVSEALWAVVAPLVPPQRPKDLRSRAARGCPDRDRVRAEDRDPVGVPAAGDGLRQRNDLLAPPAGPAAPGAPAHGGAGRIDWSRASADAARVPAKGGGRPVRARDTVRQRAAIGRR
jgi:hypothetical protein